MTPQSITHLPPGTAWWIPAVAVAALALHIGGVSGVARIARHLWRMCFALFFAAASFFLGQQKVMPAFMHGSPLLSIPALAPLVLMVFWLVRVRYRKWFPGREARSLTANPALGQPA